MTNQTLSQLLVLLLCGISSARIFFSKDSETDPVATVPAFALVTALLNIAAFGSGPFELANLLISFLTFCVNFRALLRFNARLIVDHFSIPFVLGSIINLILTALLLAATLYFCPAKADLKKFKVKETSYSYYGNFSQGFKQIDKFFSLNSVIVKKYEQKSPKSEGERLILFVPNECTSISDYEPFFVKLARDGFTVYAAEFYSSDVHYFNDWRDLKPFRRQFMRYAKLFNQKLYKKAVAHKTQNIIDQYEALSSMLNIKSGTFTFAISDTGLEDKGEALHSVNPQTVYGNFDLSEIPSYPTPGWGPVQQTDPLIAKKFGLKKDRKLYMSSHIATVAEEKIAVTEQITSEIFKAQEQEQ